MLKAFYQVHKWLALCVALLLLPQLVSGVYLSLTRTFGEPAAELAPGAVSLDRIVAAADSAAAGLRLDRLTFDPLAMPQVEVRAWSANSAVARFIEVDATTGQVVAAGGMYQFLDRTMLYLHANFIVGGLGRWLVALGGASLLILLVSGLVLWWPRGRTWRDAFTLHTRWSPKLLLFDVHRVVGAWAGAIAVVTILAGTVMALQPMFAPSIPADACSERDGVEQPAPITLDDAWAQVAAVNSAVALRQVRLCGANRRVVGFLFTTPAAAVPLTQVWIDRHDPASMRRIVSGEGTVSAWLDPLLLPVHTGRMAGGFGEFLVSVIGLGLLTLLVTGFVLWVVRARERRAKRLRRRQAQAAEAQSLEVRGA